MKKILIHTEYIKLDQFLKWCGVAQTGGEATEMIRGGEISVNGQTETARGKKLYSGDVVNALGTDYAVVTE